MTIVGFFYKSLVNDSGSFGDALLFRFSYLLLSPAALFINMLASLVQLRKAKQIVEVEDFGSPIPQVVIAVIPFVVIISCVLNDATSFHSKNIVLDFKYQSGFSSSSSRVIVGDNKCSTSSTGNDFNGKLEPLEITSYSVEKGGKQVTQSYKDEELSGIDLELTARIVADSKKHIKKEFEDETYCASIEKLGQSGYYIISNIRGDSDSGGCGGLLLGDYGYKDDVFVCEVDVSGDIDKAYKVSR